jgi:hypothetical protein
MFRNTILWVLLVISIISCNRQKTFDSNKWKETGGESILTKERLQMTNDLLAKQILINKTKNQIDSLLGPSFIFQTRNTDKKYYMVQEVYTTNIDPDELIFLEIDFDSAGISISAELKGE